MQERSTPLFRASFTGNTEGVIALLNSHEGPEDINQKNDVGLTQPFKSN